MTHAVTNIAAINAITPAASGFGVHWYSRLDPNTPMNVAACNNFNGGLSHAV